MSDFEIFMLGSAFIASVLAYSYVQLTKYAEQWVRMWKLHR
ncbi:hypothetical protein Asulf_00966 [Archaeoglobus sulfaticallidus PM70-1]|uniref:Uncharacterized protein n=1 Tax=Archaeoglobus sulfaticallidus PM70-1 TaxID=387631 RepID=N0BL97_9EURY|nr:hypothetical protein [Archaeoglobus sulfaticallidus]AGK60970.1 hypothetical protein Asulf_00966 [Archaeoglobus sulfaticallidus PM70-1]